MSMENFKIFLKLALLMLAFPLATSVNAAPITYYDLDFEDGGFGGGVPFGGSFGSPQNVASSNLDGRSLLFDLNDQMVWSLNGPDSDYHYIAFDYYAVEGANVTHFLDVPSILRSDANLAGRHRVELYYDFIDNSVLGFIDGTLSASLVTITAWPALPASSQIRLANQIASPGNSEGIFEIDNLLWQGDVVYAPVPEPTTLLLLSTGLLGMGWIRWKKA